jgi:hypothetical protein
MVEQDQLTWNLHTHELSNLKKFYLKVHEK